MAVKNLSQKWNKVKDKNESSSAAAMLLAENAADSQMSSSGADLRSIGQEVDVREGSADASSSTSTTTSSDVVRSTTQADNN